MTNARRLGLVHNVAPAVVLLLAVHVAVAADNTENESDVHEPPLTSQDRAHWSFQRLNEEIPQQQAELDLQWVRNRIDRYVLAALRRQGLSPQAEAPRRVLIRRLWLDLLGLPPTAAEVRRFLDDQRPLAYERLVERVLALPSYGERRAQFWLDLARFAETDGFEHDKVRRNAWHYRDWVIAAANRDMPYDQFVRWQLAGDELASAGQAGTGNSQQDQMARASAATATAFCLAGPDMPDINSQVERRHNLLNEITSTVSAVFLGLQLECAQCHNHKYDALSQADFYRLRAVFSPGVQLKRNESVDVLRQGPARPSYLWIRGDWRRQGPAVLPGVPRVVDWRSGALPLQATSPHSLTATENPRTALARWLCQPQNPLTGRVMVNRLWSQHFGRGLVGTPSDFGVMGELPTHPRLLDFLAAELIRQDWSIKAIQRLIVSSATYRQRSLFGAGMAQHQDPGAAPQTAWQLSLGKDPDARWLSRFPRRRLEAEVIRDAMLAASGTLNRQHGGPGIRPPLPPELLKTLLKNQWPVTQDRSQHYRRSIYLFARRNLRFPIFEAFDRPAADASCARRDQSITAPQALLMLNSDFSLEMAKRLAGQAAAETETESARVRYVFERTLGRVPNEMESAWAASYLAQQTAGYRRAPVSIAASLPTSFKIRAGNDPAENRARGAALTSFCLALFNVNEFIYVD